MESYIRSLISLLLLAILCSLLTPSAVSAQVTIEEEIELQESTTPELSADDGISIQSHRDPKFIVAENDGQLKIYIERLIRYLKPLPANFSIKVEVKNGNKSDLRTFELAEYMDRPLAAPTISSCPDDWYLYGEGLFAYLRTIGPDEGKDAWISSLVESRKQLDGTWETYSERDLNADAYSGLDIEFLPPLVNDYWRRPDPSYKYAFLAFDLMLPPTISVHKAELELTEWQVSRELEEDKSFYLHAVSESWGEGSITWNNQPSVAGEPIEVPKSSRRERKYINLRWYEIDIAGFVNKWITNPSTNHGVRISLKDTGDKDYIDFGSTEAKDRFLSNIAPEVKIIFGNPEWNPESRIIDAGFLSRGDTATISYENFGTNSASMYPDNTRIIDTTKVTGNDLNFYNQHETNQCQGYLTTERLDLFVFMEDSNADELLLGESKYYYAVEDPEKEDKLLLMELPVADGKPQLDQLPGEALSNPFDGNPVEMVSSGGKSGVYWEKKYPEISSDGTLIMHDLPSGIIRLAGRYWEAGKYKVKLKANHGGKTGELEITVVKPDRLGDQYGKARDVFDRVVDVDSLIIANAGKYGIPPQFIKAHISVEAAKKNFGGDVGWGFAPSYRYEPYTTQNDRYLKDWSGKFFFKDSLSAYFSDVPKHLHVEDRNYYISVKSVWNVIKEESQLVSNSGGKPYGKRDANGKIDFGKYATIQSKYDSFYKIVKEDTTKTLTQLADSTNRLMAKYLRDEWKVKYRSEVGAKNMIAQTRAASSYGFLQMLYTTARDEVDYQESKVPEKMNENEFFEEFLIYQRKLLKDRISKNNESEFNWNEGYEMLLRNSIFKIWNLDTGYPETVLIEVNNYMPYKN